MRTTSRTTSSPELADVLLDKLTTIQIQRFYNNLQKTGRVQRKNFPELKDKSLSPRVVRGVHTLLHNCLEQAVAERLLLANPAQGCKLPQLEKREMKILPQEKIGMYLAEAEKRGLLAAFYLELTTGLRRGELLALQWTDLDVESKTLSITKQVNRINGELAVSPPKTRNSIRTLALPQQAVDLLIAEHKKHSRNPYLFPSPKTGTMYDPDAFRRTRGHPTNTSPVLKAAPRWGHQPADAVNMAKNTGPDRKIPVWPCPVLSAPFPVWVSV